MREIERRKSEFSHEYMILNSLKFRLLSSFCVIFFTLFLFNGNKQKFSYNSDFFIFC